MVTREDKLKFISDICGYMSCSKCPANGDIYKKYASGTHAQCNTMKDMPLGLIDAALDEAVNKIILDLRNDKENPREIINDYLEKEGN